jgi:hypothetical protein
MAVKKATVKKATVKKATVKKATVKKTSSKVIKPISTKSVEQRWKKAVAKGQGADISYDMSGTYRVNDIVSHVTFGRGVVQEVFDKKIAIIFQDKERVLVASR